MTTFPMTTSSTTGDTVSATSRWERLGLASGIVAAALVFVATAIFLAFVVPYMPPIDGPAQQAATFYAALNHSHAYKFVSYLGEAQMMFLMLFFGALFAILRRVEGVNVTLSSAVFAAGNAILIITPLAMMLEDHLLLGAAGAGADPLMVRTFDGVVPLSFALSGFAQIVAIGGTTALLLPQRQLPRWLGVFAFAIAVLSLIGSGTLVVPELFPFAALAMLLFRVWIAAVSISLLQGTQTTK